MDDFERYRSLVIGVVCDTSLALPKCTDIQECDMDNTHFNGTAYCGEQAGHKYIHGTIGYWLLIPVLFQESGAVGCTLH